MKYRTHPLIGWICLGATIGCLLGIVGVTFAAMNTTRNETLVILGSWAIALWWIAVLGGIVASHTIPNRFERKDAVRHAHRLADALARIRGPRT